MKISEHRWILCNRINKKDICCCSELIEEKNMFSSHIKENINTFDCTDQEYAILQKQAGEYAQKKNVDWSKRIETILSTAIVAGLCYYIIKAPVSG